jgi:aerobic carbon-monoxide dehydrogenase medium subunit
MTPFELVEPATLHQALELLDPEDMAVRPLGGGTALMLMMKSGLFAPRRLVGLSAIEQRYRCIETSTDGAIEIGAMMTLRQLETSGDVRRHAPVIAETLRTLANVRVRNVATVGGNLAHGDPHMDLPPVLLALGANVAIAGATTERRIPLADFHRGYYETALATDELIVGLGIPDQTNVRAAYLKCTTRSADDWPALGVSVALKGEGSEGLDVKVVVSAATETPIRLAGAESVLEGTKIDDAVLRRAGDAAADEAELISDQRGTAAYKRELLRVCVARAVRKALAAPKSVGRGGER